MQTGQAVVLVALIATAAVPVAAGHDGDPRVGRADYDLAPPGPVASSTVPTPVGPLDVGGTRLPIQEAEHSLEVFVLDETTFDVPGRVAFYDDEGNQLAASDFCFKTLEQVPEGAANAVVRPSAGVDPCPIGPGTSPAVRGEVLFVFR